MLAMKWKHKAFGGGKRKGGRGFGSVKISPGGGLADDTEAEKSVAMALMSAQSETGVEIEPELEAENRNAVAAAILSAQAAAHIDINPDLLEGNDAEKLAAAAMLSAQADAAVEAAVEGI